MSEYRQGYNDGWERGWDRAAANLVPILTDLIAELWSMAEYDDHLTEWIGPNLEHAEQRLREVRGDE